MATAVTTPSVQKSFRPTSMTRLITEVKTDDNSLYRAVQTCMTGSDTGYLKLKDNADKTAIANPGHYDSFIPVEGRASGSVKALVTTYLLNVKPPTHIHLKSLARSLNKMIYVYYADGSTTNSYGNLTDDEPLRIISLGGKAFQAVMNVPDRDKRLESYLAQLKAKMMAETIDKSP